MRVSVTHSWRIAARISLAQPMAVANAGAPSTAHACAISRDRRMRSRAAGVAAKATACSSMRASEGQELVARADVVGRDHDRAGPLAPQTFEIGVRCYPRAVRPASGLGEIAQQ